MLNALALLIKMSKKDYEDGMMRMLKTRKMKLK